MRREEMSGKNVIFSTLQKTQIPEMSLGQYMLDCLRRNGSSVAFIDAATGEEITYREILESSIHLAESMKSRGLKSGDRVAVCSENRLNLIIPTFASLYIGAALAPLNPTYGRAELLHALNISKPSIIFVSPRTEDAVKEIVDKLNPRPQIIQLSSEQTSSDIPTLPNVIAETEPVRDLDSFADIQLPDSKKQVAAILCSSGTTGLPKGVMLSHHNLMMLVQHFRSPHYSKLSQDRPMLKLVPYFHGYGFGLTLGLTACNGKAVMMTQYDPILFLRSIQTYKIVVLPIVPPIMVFLAKDPIVSRFDLSSIKEISCGAAPLSEEIEKTVMDRLGVPCIRQAYGMTELTIICTMTPATGNKLGSVGILSADTSCKVVDTETGQALGPGQRGELCFNGDLVMMGYCGNPEATAETIDKDGWLHTGDIGYYDEDGFIFVVDRLKELIKYKGFQVPPAELEAILLTHPAVRDAAVIGIPDENSGELPMAFIVKQSGVEASAVEIRKFVDDQVSPPKRLRGGVKFVGAIPKNPSGKILRRELRLQVSKL